MRQTVAFGRIAGIPVGARHGIRICEQVNNDRQGHDRRPATSRVRTLEAVGDYLRYVCQRARAGQSEQMWA
jgi:hypothetical protein